MIRRDECDQSWVIIPWGPCEEEVLALRGDVEINDIDGTVDLHAIMKVLMIMKDFQRKTSLQYSSEYCHVVHFPNLVTFSCSALLLVVMIK